MSANAGPVSSATAPAVPEVPAEAVTPLIRGISVLLRLTEADGMLSLSGLERATGLARSTVDRITATLERMDYVRLDGRDAVLAPGLMELGNAYLSALRLPRLLSGYADALMALFVAQSAGRLLSRHGVTVRADGHEGDD